MATRPFPPVGWRDSIVSVQPESVRHRHRTTPSSTAASSRARAISLISSVSSRISSTFNNASTRRTSTRANPGLMTPPASPTSAIHVNQTRRYSVNNKENERPSDIDLPPIKNNARAFGAWRRKTDMSDYRERAGTFSQSSPELSQSMGLSIHQLCEQAPPSPIGDGGDTDTREPQNTRPWPLIGGRRHRTPSPSLEDNKSVARAEALAKLTAPSTPVDESTSDADEDRPAPRIPSSFLRHFESEQRLSHSDTGHSSSDSTALTQAARDLPPRPWSAGTSAIRTSPIDINLRGRQLRAKSSEITSAVPSSHRPARSSFDGSTFGSRSDIDSSRSTEASSVDSLLPRKVESSSSPSVTFAERPRGVDREKDWGAPSTSSLYALRRGSESAVDFLSVVEEDDRPGGNSVESVERLSATPRKAKRISAEHAPILRLDGLPFPPERSTGRRSFGDATASRPLHLGLSRTSSMNAVNENADRSELPQEDAQLQRPRMSLPPPHSKPPVSLYRNASTASSSALPVRPRHHRWTSEVYLEKVDRGEMMEQRSRRISGTPHRSSTDEAADRPTRVARTKLILRHNGRPTLTYQLGECIGKGQFGSVYRALNLNSGRVVAVKRILLEGKTPEEVAQLSSEVAMLQRLEHPSVVKYEGIVKTDHYLNIVLEYVENGSLQKTMRHFGELPEPLVASYVVKILEGLDYLHSKQVVHCDLKAANILSTKHGNIKLSDFGTSLILTALQNSKVQEDHEINGTPNWMAPEVIELKGATTASDIWSLGCTIIELIDSGRPPYSEHNAMSAMFHIVTDEHPPIPDRCSAELCDFLYSCFAKDPRERPTAGELFHHPWIQKNWDQTKDLRPQDSIPFIRRLSSDRSRSSQSPIQETDFEGRASPSPSLDPFLASPTASPSRPIPFPRTSLDSGFRSGDVRPPLSREATSASRQSEEVVRAHNFVKTAFSKAIECRLCGEHTKRNAVLCAQCGLVAHSRCAEFAPTCDFRSLLEYETPRPPLLSASPPSSRSGSPLAQFSLGDIVPFGMGGKRPKAISHTSSSSFQFNSSVGELPTRNPAGLRSLVDLLSTRSRVSPQSSISAASEPPQALSLYANDQDTAPEPLRNRRVSMKPTSLELVKSPTQRSQQRLETRKELRHRRTKSAQPADTDSKTDCTIQ